MGNVRKLLAAACCGAAVLLSLSWTPPKSAAFETAAPTPAAYWDEEVFTDHCSGDVNIKAPFPWPDVPLPPGQSLGSKDIVLARSVETCRLVAGSEATHRGVCQRSPGAWSEWTDPVPYISIMDKIGGTRRFRWYCTDAGGDVTRERSRCREGTTKVRFRIGPNRAFQTKCLP